jgi:hypothetical protein
MVVGTSFFTIAHERFRYRPSVQLSKRNFPEKHVCGHAATSPLRTVSGDLLNDRPSCSPSTCRRPAPPASRLLD